MKTVIADREADIYPLLTGLTQQLSIEYIIRTHFDRSAAKGSSILGEVGLWSKESCYQIKVAATDKRSAHIAKMVVKFGQSSIKKCNYLSTW